MINYIWFFMILAGVITAASKAKSTRYRGVLKAVNKLSWWQQDSLALFPFGREWCRLPGRRINAGLSTAEGPSTPPLS